MSKEKELFVSSTPHETKVAIVEDDQLAEIYFERENEYTLAGSIYKGRVTRVLPGMQSAFVDIGLERDAFLYVTDFFEEHGESEEFEEVPTGGREERRPQEPRVSAPAAPEPAPAKEEERAPQPARAESQPQQPREGDDGPRRWRGRRRRGGRGRGFPDDKFTRPAEERPEARPERPERGRPERPERPAAPPPQYQPIILPGESISKYRHLAQPQPPPPAATADRWQSEAETLAHSMETLPQTLEHDFEKPQEREQPETFTAPAARGSFQITGGYDQESEESQPPAAAAFAAPVPEPARDEREPRAEREQGAAAAPAFADASVVEEEEMGEEENDLPEYLQQYEDSDFEEMEEETLEGSGPRSQIIAVGDELGSAIKDSMIEEAATGTYESNGLEPQMEEQTEEEEEEEEEEDEEEEQSEADAAQARAEAEAEGEFEEQKEPARAEVRGPAGVAGFQQRAPRTERTERGDDRSRRGRRGGRRMRGRRMVQHGPRPAISELLKEGQEILVQIAKEPIAKKGARITSHIALPGRFLVYMPTVAHIGVSRKIASDEERQRLKRILLSERDGSHGGFIVRTAAAGASEDDLRADIRFLINLWKEIRNRADQSKAPALIYHDLNLVERILRDQVTQNFAQIWTDSETEYERVTRFAQRFQPALLKRIKLYTKETPLFEQFNIQEEVNKALKSKVWLKSGGYIVINQTEALVAIDINTGKYVGKTSRLEDTIVKTNVDAIKEIVRQIRLRDLGGIIVIDFIDMDERRNRQKVMQALEEELRNDRAPSKVLQFNDFGLVAITRKRVKQSLERTLGQPCTYCTGTGLIKSVTTICNEIYVEMRKMLRHLDRGDVILRVNPEVAKALKANNARWLTEMEELTGKSVIVRSDPALHQEQFDMH